ncbi:MAG: cell division protein FtsL [Deltaproteobacteria bacterium]|nr:cell division protein FtsL [Deltaproteobacteria bacterium]
MAVKKTQKPTFTGLWLVMLLLFIGELFFYTWCRVNNVRLGYEFANQTEKKNRLLAYQNNLKIELASLKSPERIARIANNQLGLSMPRAEQTIVMP